MREYRVGRLNGRFVVSWWEDGKRRRYRLEADSLGAAEREALDVINRETTSPETITIADVWEAYRTAKSGRRVAVAMEFEGRVLKPFMGHFRPDQITDSLCEQYAAHRRATKARNGKGNIQDGSIWTELGHLRSALVWAAKAQLIKSAPEVKRPSKPMPKERYLTRQECERLINAATETHVRLAILLMLSTAARVGAVLDLTWDRVNFDRGFINLRRADSITRKGRAVVPINDGLMAALTVARKAALTDHVIEWAGAPIKSIKTGFNAAVKAAGLTDVSPHVLRHTAAVHLAEAGVPMAEIANYLGHEDSRVTERVYARFSPSHLRSASNVLDFATIRQVR